MNTSYKPEKKQTLSVRLSPDLIDFIKEISLRDKKKIPEVVTDMILYCQKAAARKVL